MTVMTREELFEAAWRRPLRNRRRDGAERRGLAQDLRPARHPDARAGLLDAGARRYPDSSDRCWPLGGCPLAREPNEWDRRLKL